MKKLRAQFIHFRAPIGYCVPGAALSPQDARGLIVTHLINRSINSDIRDRWDTDATRNIMDSVTDWVTLELRLGGVTGVSQVD